MSHSKYRQYFILVPPALCVLLIIWMIVSAPDKGIDYSKEQPPEVLGKRGQSLQIPAETRKFSDPRNSDGFDAAASENAHQEALNDPDFQPLSDDQNADVRETGNDMLGAPKELFDSKPQVIEEKPPTLDAVPDVVPDLALTAEKSAAVVIENPTPATEEKPATVFAEQVAPSILGQAASPLGQPAAAELVGQPAAVPSMATPAASTNATVPAPLASLMPAVDSIEVTSSTTADEVAKSEVERLVEARRKLVRGDFIASNEASRKAIIGDSELRLSKSVVGIAAGVPEPEKSSDGIINVDVKPSLKQETILERLKDKDGESETIAEKLDGKDREKLTPQAEAAIEHLVESHNLKLRAQDDAAEDTAKSAAETSADAARVIVA